MSNIEQLKNTAELKGLKPGIYLSSEGTLLEVKYGSPSSLSGFYYKAVQPESVAVNRFKAALAQEVGALGNHRPVKFLGESLEEVAGLPNYLQRAQKLVGKIIRVRNEVAGGSRRVRVYRLEQLVAVENYYHVYHSHADEMTDARGVKSFRFTQATKEIMSSDAFITWVTMLEDGEVLNGWGWEVKLAAESPDHGAVEVCGTVACPA